MFTSSFQLFLGNALALLRGVPRHAAGEKKNLHNVVICRTNDEVNVDLVSTWCAEHGLVCRSADQRDDLFLADARAVVLDLNHLIWGPKERTHFVEELLCHTLPPYPVAIASYDLETEEKSDLRGRGFLVFRRVDRQMLDALAPHSSTSHEEILGRGPNTAA
jgi:hypothetical protein